MEKHVDLIGVLWIALGALTFFGGLVVFWLLFGISFIPDVRYEGGAILRAVGLGIAVFLFLLSIPKIIAGIGLLKRQEWGRILTLIVAFLSLVNFPLGTALAVYSFIILIKDETLQLFRHGAG
ncbi:MAG: hypothetical protein ACE5LV_07895 [Candidatus Aminicenantales bacterium]